MIRPVVEFSEDKFGEQLARVLSPARPLQSQEYLRGRADQLEGIKKALYQKGRHVLVHGLRGVGKSSLAQTSAYSLSRKYDPVLVSCDETSTFISVVREIFDATIGMRPDIEKRVRELGVSFSRFGISSHGKDQITFGRPADPGTLS